MGSLGRRSGSTPIIESVSDILKNSPKHGVFRLAVREVEGLSEQQMQTPRVARRDNEVRGASKVNRGLSLRQLSPRAAVTYGVRQRHDALHLLFLGQVRRVDENRVRRLNRL